MLRAHLKGHSEGLEDLAVEMLARGLSVRDIKDAFRDESGRLLLSRTAVSEMGARLWEDDQDFATRDLSEYVCARRIPPCLAADDFRVFHHLKWALSLCPRF